MARFNHHDPDSPIFIPQFMDEHVLPDGRPLGVRKVPQTAMFEVTVEGKGDFPHALKGQFTSIRTAEKAVRLYLKGRAKAEEADKAMFLSKETPKEKKTTLSLGK